jgi:hypothetical protein
MERKLAGSFKLRNIGSLWARINETAAGELTKYKLGLLRELEVRWRKSDISPTDDCTCLL